MNIRKTKDILLSIHPNYATEIVKGIKKYEYRTKIPQHIKFIYLYETAPKQKVTALFSVENIIEATPIELWKQTNEYASISKKDFFKYFKNKKRGYAIELDLLMRYPNGGIEIEYFNISKPPQSFCYINKE